MSLEIILLRLNRKIKKLEKKCASKKRIFNSFIYTYFEYCFSLLISSPLKYIGEPFHSSSQ